MTVIWVLVALRIRGNVPPAEASRVAGLGTTARLKRDSHVLEQVFSALHQDDAIERGVFTHGAADAISSYHKLSKEKNKCKTYGE